VIVLDARTRIAAPARGHQRLPGVRWAVGMPDLHPGKGHPVGVAVLTDGIVYPHLVGSDIGCGVALFASDLSSRAARPDRLAKRLRGLEGAWEGDAAGWLLERGVTDPVFAESLGTIGGGNHFAELQAFETLEDPARVEALGLDESSLVLLVHSGSRGFGESILRAHVAEHGARGVDVDGGAGRSYLGSHDRAVTWASANRTLIAHRVATALGTEARPVLDVCHNAVTPWGGGWLHRKGAAPHDAGIRPDPRLARHAHVSRGADGRRDRVRAIAGARRGAQVDAKRRPRPHARALPYRRSAAHAPGGHGRLRGQRSAVRRSARRVQADRSGRG